MTNKDKQLLAQALTTAAGNLLDSYQDESGFWGTIEHIPAEEVRAQLAQWLKNLPGTGWDNRLGNL